MAKLDVNAHVTIIQKKSYKANHEIIFMNKLEQLDQKISEAISLFEKRSTEKQQIKFSLKMREVSQLMIKIKPKTVQDAKQFAHLMRKLEEAILAKS